MTVFSANGVDLNVVGASFVMDLQNYYSYIQISSLVFMPVGTKIVMENTDKINLYVINCFFEENSYSFSCLTEDQYSVISKLAVPFQGEASASEVIRNWGFKARLQVDSEKTWWMTPSQSFKSCIRCLNKWTVFPNGGAPRFYLHYGGEILGVDLRLAYKDEPDSVVGDVKSDITDSEWQLITPGNVRCFVSNVDEFVTHDITQDDKMMWSGLIINDCNGHVRALRETAFINEYFYRTFTSRQIVVENVTSMPHRLGQCVKILDTGEKGIVTKLVVPIPLNNEDTRISLRVSCQGLLELKS